MKTRKRDHKSAMNPLPSLIRASSFDAGNMHMRAAGRSKWSRDDYNHAAETQNRLFKACYSLPDDTDENMCFIRVWVADAMEKQGVIDLYTDWSTVMPAIEATLRQMEETSAQDGQI